MMESVSTRWRLFSTKIGLKESTLDAIERKHPEDTRTCLYRALAEWLKLKYDHSKHGVPCWRRLAKGVRTIDHELFVKICKCKFNLPEVSYEGKALNSYCQACDSIMIVPSP